MEIINEILNACERFFSNITYEESFIYGGIIGLLFSIRDYMKMKKTK